MIIITLAWRNIWRNKLRSLIIIGSVAMGLMAGLFVLSLYEGILEDRVRKVIDTEVSHLQIHHRRFKEDYDAQFYIPHTDTMIRVLNKIPAIKATSFRIVCLGMLMTGTGSAGVQIIGIDSENENNVSAIADKIVEGALFESDKKAHVIIGKKLANKMHLRIGNKVILTFTDAESNIVSAAFRISALYQTDNAPRDEQLVYAPRAELAKLLSIGNSAHEVAIILNNDNLINETKSRITNQFPQLQTETWSEISPETKLMIDTTDSYSRIFIMIIMLALSFGIINTMLMAVLERSREIGMLIAIGMNRQRVFQMILTETVLLTITGVPLGIFLTWLFVQHYHTTGIDISAIGGVTMSEFGFSSVIYPHFPWEKMPEEIIIVMMVAGLSSLIPAIKAIRLKPAEALQK